VAVQKGLESVPLVGGKTLSVALGDSIGEEITVQVRLPAAAGAFSPLFAVLRGSVLRRVLAPRLRAPLEPDVVSTVPLPLSCSTSVLQALEVLPRLEQVRPLSWVSPLCCVSRLPHVRCDAQAFSDVRGATPCRRRGWLILCCCFPHERVPRFGVLQLPVPEFCSPQRCPLPRLLCSPLLQVLVALPSLCLPSLTQVMRLEAAHGPLIVRVRCGLLVSCMALSNCLRSVSLLVLSCWLTLQCETIWFWAWK